MTDQEIQQAVNYFTEIRNSDRVWIEAEIRHKDKIKFDSKWGIELGCYYISDNNTPEPLLNRSNNNSRHKYTQYDKRINYNKLIWKLFKNGFQLGQN